MPRFEVYIDLDVSITTESARFTIEAESREAARAIAEEVMARIPYDAAVYPDGTVEGGTPGAEIEWIISTNDPDTIADIDVGPAFETKSEVVTDAADALGVGITTVGLAELGPEDTRGFVVPKGWDRIEGDAE